MRDLKSAKILFKVVPVNQVSYGKLYNRNKCGRIYVIETVFVIQIRTQT